RRVVERLLIMVRVLASSASTVNIRLLIVPALNSACAAWVLIAAPTLPERVALTCPCPGVRHTTTTRHAKINLIGLIRVFIVGSSSAVLSDLQSRECHA